MILRKPYAFLIKHFRLIHLLIVAILTYLVIKNRSTYSYLGDIINNSANKYDAINYIYYGIYWLIGISIILCYVIYYLLKYKNKPKRVYIFTIIGYVIIGIFMFILYNYMRSFGNNVIVQKTIRLYKDILLITLFFQYYIIAFMLIRGLGFDIKKFNFNKDSIELGINTSDSEEVEVNTGIDTTNMVRSVRKQKRELSYFFKEFKLYIIPIILIIIIISIYKGYNYFNKNYKIYNENELVGNEYNIMVKNSYYVDKYIIVNLDIYKHGRSNKLNMGSLELNIKDNKYLADKNICYKFNNYGNCYKNQLITHITSQYQDKYYINHQP